MAKYRSCSKLTAMPRAAQRNPWTTVSLTPLIGLLDTRSRPADIPAGAWRWALNFQTTSEGKRCRRDGHLRAFDDVVIDGRYQNQDLHHQGATRQPITFEMETTKSDGTRRFYAGTQSRIYLLDEATGLYDTIASGFGAPGSYWRADVLQDVILFTNGNPGDQILQSTLGTNTTAPVSDFYAVWPNQSVPQNIKGGHVIIQYAGVLMLMNFTDKDGTHPVRIMWCDINNPASWIPGANNGASIADYQDLDYGDEILNAVVMQGSVYVFTRRAIWKVSVSAAASNASFAFTRVYVEPLNQTGCLTFPRTLVSMGTEVRYMSRDSIYRFDPYIAAPEREDWLLRASGVIFRKADTALSGLDCGAPCAGWIPSKRELWISWPSGTHSVNNWSLVNQIDYKTSDVVDHGYTAFCNFRRTPQGILCNERQDFLVASGEDWTIKSLGGVFFREMVLIASQLIDDIDLLDPIYQQVGYYSILRAQIPTGLFDRDKIVRKVLVDDDISEEAAPGKYQIRIGNSYNIADTNESSAAANLPVNNVNIRCAIQWKTLDQVPESGYKGEIACLDPGTIGSMTARGLKPANGREFPCYEQNRFLWFELTIMEKNGAPRIGTDACLQRIDFDLLALPKP